MPIFEANLLRINTVSKLNTQTDYDYLNQSALPEAEKIRNLLNECFELYDYGDIEKNEILQRIIGAKEVDFYSACFELLVNALLIRQGYKLRPHPQLQDSSKHPDFLVTSPNSDEFYLELVTSIEKTQSSNLKTILDVFENNKHSNFFVGIRHNNGEMKQTPKIKDLTKTIITWLDSLDPDAILNEIQQKQILHGSSTFAGPSINWTHEKFEIEITAIPISQEYRGQARRLFGVSHSDVQWIDNSSIIKKSLKVKASRYGELDKPFVIAVALRPSEFTFGLDKDDEKQALFGTYQYILDAEKCLSELRFSGDGLWVYNSQPTNTRVSGVWFFDNIDPYSLERLRSNLFFNPWANKPLNSTLKEFPHTILDLVDNKFETDSGIFDPMVVLKIKEEMPSSK